MKIISFFNEKGGVGKSTFSIMYASWLHYRHGVKTCIVDYDNRLEKTRANEIQQWNKAKVQQDKNNPVVPYDPNNIYPIITVTKQQLDTAKQYSKAPAAHALIDLLKTNKEQLQDTDVIIVDCPGQLNDGPIFDISMHKLLTMCIIPIKLENQAIRSSIRTRNFLYAIMHDNNRIFGFMNQIEKYMSISKYEAIANLLMETGIKMLPDLVSNSARFDKFQSGEIMRSTLYAPNWDSKTFEGGRDHGTENLFIDITKQLDKMPELRIYEHQSDLSFIRNIQKKDDPTRQLKENGFADLNVMPKNK